MPHLEILPEDFDSPFKLTDISTYIPHGFTLSLSKLQWEVK